MLAWLVVSEVTVIESVQFVCSVRALARIPFQELLTLM